MGHLSASLDAILLGGLDASVTVQIRRSLKKFLSQPSACWLSIPDDYKSSN
jgi:hypothetical protein